MIVGVGVDLVDLARFDRAATRTPALLTRLFTAEETMNGSDRALPLRSLAGRFAAKEALIKAVGDSTGMRWHDMRVVSDALGNPSFAVFGAMAGILERCGVTALHLSMSHDGGLAIAYVIAEGPSTVASSSSAGPR
ncbi:MAG: holo-ACP synthase [Terrimesophilobacter sp.]